MARRIQTVYSEAELQAGATSRSAEFQRELAEMLRQIEDEREQRGVEPKSTR